MPLYFTPMLHDSGHAVLAAARRAALDADVPLLLAVSGGLDSMALLHAMAAVARPRVAAVATFDHGTGAAATAAAAHVAREAAALGLPVVAGRNDEGTGAGGAEAAWRRARYEFLGAAAASLGARVVTAHSEDDQVETVLMRVLRGSGARGLAALYAPADVVRPFVRLRRAALAAYVHRQGIRWHEDPSNRSTAHQRNRVRHDLLPALRRADPGIDDAMLRAAREAAQWRAEVDAHVASHVDARVTGRSLAVKRSELTGYDADSLAVLWSALAGRVGLALDRRGTHRLAAFTISDRRAGAVPLSGGWRVELSHERFVLRPALADAGAAAPLPDRGTLEWGAFRFRAAGPEGVAGSTRETWTAALPVGSRLTVRGWTAGDRLAPAAGQQRRRVKRYLTEAGVRGLDRRGWPVVVADDDVVWIPGVRRSDAATERSGRPVRSYVCERLDR
jgi:tRNA(Ile)-lysidine synthase